MAGAEPESFDKDAVRTWVTARCDPYRDPIPEIPDEVVIEAARVLFLRQGYAGTTMEEIAALAGRTKGTVYNNFADKNALFTEIVTGVTGFAETFAEELREEFGGIDSRNVAPALHALGARLALAILRPEVVELRRLLIGEVRSFPALAKRYYERAPERVINTLAFGFGCLTRDGLLYMPDARRAAAQFAYLVAGENLDRAVLSGLLPDEEEVVAGAREGVQTFLARYGTDSATRTEIGR